jgi:hypothetical protein
MAINLLTPDIEFGHSQSILRAEAFGHVASRRLPATTQEVQMTLRRIFIRRASDFLGKAEIQVLSIVTDGVSAEPIQLCAEVYSGIKRKTELPLAPGGIALYRTSAGKVPEFIDYRILVMELDDDVRQTGELLDSVRQDEQFKQFRSALLAATALAAPPVALITAATDFALNLVARLLKADKDDQLLLVRGSFSNTFDDLGTKYGLIPHANRNAEIAYDVQAA